MNNQLNYFLEKITMSLGIPYEYLSCVVDDVDDGAVDIRVDEYREDLLWP